MCTARVRRRRPERVGERSRGISLKPPKCTAFSAAGTFLSVSTMAGQRPVAVFPATGRAGARRRRFGCRGCSRRCVEGARRPRLGGKKGPVSPTCGVVSVGSTFMSGSATGVNRAQTSAIQALATSRPAFSSGMWLAQRPARVAVRAMARWRVSTGRPRHARGRRVSHRDFASPQFGRRTAAHWQ
jgi:hypothetical protein